MVHHDEVIFIYTKIRNYVIKTRFLVPVRVFVFELILVKNILFLFRRVLPYISSVKLC